MNIVNEYGIIGIYYICVNVIAFILYGLDKKYAREGRWRIPEKTLLGIAMIGGAAGAWIGMRDADFQAQDKAHVIPDAGAVVCSGAYVDDSKIYKSDIMVTKS